MRVSKIECLKNKAEGTIGGFPYNTKLVSSQGVHFHIWIGDVELPEGLLEALTRTASNHRDVVRMTYSNGQPTGFWAHENF